MARSEILLVGGGGREHAIAWALEKSGAPPDTIYCAPGNAGTEGLERVQNTGITVGAMERLVDFAKERRESSADLTVIVGPEQPLFHGLVDRLRCLGGISVFGPTAQQAELERSKIYATRRMQQWGIPLPDSMIAPTMQSARDAIRYFGGASKCAIKADGPAAGKGVVLPDNQAEADRALQLMLSGQGYEGAGKTGVVIQERLHGPELSIFVVSDGKRSVMLPFVQDHKRLRNGDEGPNTGGMGAYVPLPEGMVNKRQMAQIRRIVAKTIEQSGFEGALFIGAILAEERDGDPVVIEYNARFGDPETQALFPYLVRNGVDVHGLLRETARGQVPFTKLPQDLGGAALAVCLAAPGYPEAPQLGEPIQGLDEDYEDALIMHGGTARDRAGHIVTSGGRALYVVGLAGPGETVDVAATAAYRAIVEAEGFFQGSQYRSDIGRQARSLTL